MKIVILFLAISCSFFSCAEKKNKETSAIAYFARTDSGLQTGNIKMIPIQTSKGSFNVWTKRIGNNPRMKLLLLNGGPGATHEYFECM
jgi:proline iminopeptidase